MVYRQLQRCRARSWMHCVTMRQATRLDAPARSNHPSPHRNRPHCQAQPPQRRSPLHSIARRLPRLVIGATGAIGSANGPPAAPTALRRGCGPGAQHHPAVDFGARSHHCRRRPSSSRPNPVALHHHAVACCTAPTGMPEKRLGQLNYAQMEATFRVNTSARAGVGPLCAAAAQARGAACWPCSRPRLGSIGDNRLGGWYSYRASGRR